MTINPPSIKSHSSGGWLARHWFYCFGVIYGLWILLPCLAPVSLHIGWNGAGFSLQQSMDGDVDKQHLFPGILPG